MYQIHQTPPAAFVGFRTVYSEAVDALHLLVYQFHQSPTNWGPTFYCRLMDLGWFLAKILWGLGLMEPISYVSTSDLTILPTVIMYL